VALTFGTPVLIALLRASDRRSVNYYWVTAEGSRDSTRISLNADDRPFSARADSTHKWTYWLLFTFERLRVRVSFLSARGTALMATTAQQTHFPKPVSRRGGRWFFVTMALVMIATSIAGFLPAIISPATRRAPLTPLAEAHGIVFFMWLLLYLAQSLLIANRRVELHRRLGWTSVALLALMIPLGFSTTIAMVRQGFDLSGDQHVVPHPDGHTTQDAPTASIFNLAALLTFTILAVAAIGYRRRPDVHKRLMLFANITLISASITHLCGHFFGQSPAAFAVAFTVLFVMSLLAPVIGDYLIERRIRFLTVAIAIGLFAFQVLQIFVIAPSAAWHRFAERISQ